MGETWMIMPMIAAIWLIAIAIKDVRDNRYMLAVVSALLAVGLMITPIPTHSHTVETDLSGQQQ